MSEAMKNLFSKFLIQLSKAQNAILVCPIGDRGRIKMSGKILFKIKYSWKLCDILYNHCENFNE